MQVFKLYFRLLKKYKGSLILFSSIFLFVSLVLSGAIASDSNSSFISTKLNIGIVDEESSFLGEEIFKYFGNDHNLVHVEYDEKELVNELYWKRLDYILIIPKDLVNNLHLKKADDIVFECIKVPGMNVNELFETELKMYTNKLNSLMQSGYSIEEASKVLLQSKETHTNIAMVQSVNKHHNDRVSLFLLYVPYLFISVSITGIGTILLVFNRKEVKERMECSSTPLKQRTIGIVGGILLFGFILYIAVYIIAILLSKGSFLTDSRAPYFLLNLFVLLLFGLSLGFFVGSIAKNQDSINGLNNILGLFLCMLGGIFVPIEIMGDGIKKVSELLPTYWYMRSNEMISAMIKVTPEFTKDLLLHSSLILCYALAFFSITLVILSLKRKNIDS